MKYRLLLATAISLFLSATADAVTLNSSGVGEVIIVPYYTVQGGNETLISITNISPHTKAVRLRFRESQNGKSVQSVNLYLRSNDVWTGKITATVDNKAAKVITSDISCTFPDVLQHGLAFLSDKYSDEVGDAGPDLGRTKEGFIEIVEMGVIIDPEYEEAVKPVVGDEGGKDVTCGVHSGYWGDNGEWTKDRNAGMEGLSGGLMAEANIINVNGGVEYSQTLTVLEEFNNAEESLHYAPASDLPSLNSAFPYETKMPDDAWASPVDAVSGLLMAERLLNGFSLNWEVESATDWIVTFPTKHFYTDPDLVQEPKQPFTSIFEETDGAMGACENVDFSYWNRETMSSDDTLPAQGVNDIDLCYVVNSVQFISPDSRVASNIFDATLSDKELRLYGDNYPNGWLGMNLFKLVKDAQEPFDASDFEYHIIENTNREIYTGLPVVGFAATRLANSNVGEGAAYAATSAHRYIRPQPYKKSGEIVEFDLAVTGNVGCYSDPGPPDDPIACPVDDPPVCDSSFSDPDCPRAPYYHDGLDQSRDYDKKIEPQRRHVYKFRAPTQEETRTEMNGEDKNRVMEFSVVDYGIEVLVKLGVSLVKGRTDAVLGEDEPYCFSGPGSEGKVTVATNDKYTTCNIDFSTEDEPNYYYFTIENTDEIETGGYRFVFRAGAIY